MPTLEMYQGQVYLWHYVPSLPAAIAFTALFSLVTTVHTWKMIKLRMWFCVPFVIGGVFEVIGYIARVASYYSTGALGPYLIQAIFLVLPPVFFAASLYMVYSRVVRAVHGETFSLLPPRWASVIFVSGDLLCLNIQGGGSGMLSHPGQAHIGDDIIVAGLGIQILVFVAFMACCVSFNIRFRAHVVETGAARDIPWQACLNMLYATSLAILVRNIYRMVEFIMGHGYLFDNEWPTYAFDGALMLLVMIGFFIWYPSQLTPRDSTTDSMIELTSEGVVSAEHRRSVKP
ncbi:RTA1-domain-containing protein [Mytilinidion resinicola]|uniref:RTA1-domain-containing protein n=1 Tax=Mytilinidion resinicola TaxID=574789 RepID=A0A6A6Z9R0_9PEZI|nr:RTA1-domain-containing protein [Mytilinidion resinicola]KAF2817548.1 RTA1-domain-containing protein [Mytilinidion resinicola]